LKLFGDYINLPNASKESKAALTLSALKLYCSSNDFKSVEELLKQEKSLPVNPADLQTFKAIIAGKDSVKAIPLWHLALKAQPLDAYTILKAASFYNSIGKEQRAYDIILAGLDDNIYNVEILKAYVIQCYTLHLDSFAEDGLKRIKNLVDEGSYTSFAQSLDPKMIQP
jgi:hypothetical protein